jgi:hypothetical protein
MRWFTWLLAPVLLGLTAITAAALPLQPVVALCGQSKTMGSLLTELRKDGWTDLTSENFVAYASMVADSWLAKPKPTGDQANYFVLRFGDSWRQYRMAIMKYHYPWLAPDDDVSLLTKTNGSRAFLYIRPAPLTCRLYVSDGAFDRSEADNLLGVSKKWLTPVGYKRSRFVRDTTKEGRHYEIIATHSSAADLKAEGSFFGTANLLLEIHQFDRDQTP